MLLRFSQKQIFPLVLAASLTVIGCSHRTVPPPTGPTWKSSPALSAKLGPEVAMQDGYAIRPPIGWQEKQSRMQAADGSGTLFEWFSSRHPDGIQTRLWVLVTQDDGRGSQRFTSTDLVQMWLGRISENHTGLIASPPESGSIGGTGYARSYWKGRGVETGKYFHGMVYASVVAPISVQLQARDSEPYSKDTMPLCEASLLTMRKL